MYQRRFPRAELASDPWLCRQRQAMLRICPERQTRPTADVVRLRAGGVARRVDPNRSPSCPHGFDEPFEHKGYPIELGDKAIREQRESKRRDVRVARIDQALERHRHHVRTPPRGIGP